ncbi:hypothetical protein KXD40_001086 [Peronospora effusa]|uniref:Uncharacterized protein n=1 Tax=Peronospora effusa TaxID=542832 RepID=A0A3M6VQB1_9STRA|nr:hypothetical protein DD238_005580 [Peronospora effusa]UIZ21751.1 hypothetical protein KXD40_001086 [Peronospora effusa]
MDNVNAITARGFLYRLGKILSKKVAKPTAMKTVAYDWKSVKDSDNMFRLEKLVKWNVDL